MVGGSIDVVSMTSRLDVAVAAAILHDVDKYPSRVRLRLDVDECSNGCVMSSAIFRLGNKFQIKHLKRQTQQKIIYNPAVFHYVTLITDYFFPQN